MASIKTFYYSVEDPPEPPEVLAGRTLLVGIAVVVATSTP